MLKVALVAATLSIAELSTAPALAGDGKPEAEPDSTETSAQLGELYVEFGSGVDASLVRVTVDDAVVEVARGVPIELSYGEHRVRVAHGSIVFAETLEIGDQPRSIFVGNIAADPTGVLRIHADGIDAGDLVVKLDGEVVDHEQPIERAQGRYTLTVQYDGKLFTREVEISDTTRHIHLQRHLDGGREAPEVEELLVPEDPPEHQEMTRAEKAKAQAKKGTVLLAGGVLVTGLGVLGVYVAAEGIEQGNSDAPKALVGSASLAVIGAGSAVWGAGLLITSPVRLVTGRQSYVSPYLGPTSVGVHGVF